MYLKVAIGLFAIICFLAMVILVVNLKRVDTEDFVDLPKGQQAAANTNRESDDASLAADNNNLPGSSDYPFPPCQYISKELTLPVKTSDLPATINTLHDLTGALVNAYVISQSLNAKRSLLNLNMHSADNNAINVNILNRIVSNYLVTDGNIIPLASYTSDLPNIGGIAKSLAIENQSYDTLSSDQQTIYTNLAKTIVVQWKLLLTDDFAFWMWARAMYLEGFNEKLFRTKGWFTTMSGLDYTNPMIATESLTAIIKQYPAIIAVLTPSYDPDAGTSITTLSANSDGGWLPENMAQVNLKNNQIAIDRVLTASGTAALSDRDKALYFGKSSCNKKNTYIKPVDTPGTPHAAPKSDIVPSGINI